ncbi:hypothetical protein CYFUS_007041 [Cystobacter fuscus]|uniref:DUF676 domain-containing protein n=1 Tax=Cystobacter fuscus TaxID=43 RepID=A0A250JCF4_9BACT|nr:hypothetical protein [Cystobacter fuscus]ATB41575.1 hypothetical protein CYFUS_007041 [Cystobacter fuscus]
MISVSRKPPVVASPIPTASEQKPPATIAALPARKDSGVKGPSINDVFEPNRPSNDWTGPNPSSMQLVDLFSLDLNDPEVIQDLAETFGVENVNLYKRSDDSEFDGALVGVDKAIKMDDLQGKKDLSSIKPGELSPFQPKRLKNEELIIQVNGINTNLSEQKAALQATANATGSRVVGIHNATDGFVGDLTQSLGDKLNTGKNPAVDSMRDIVLGELRAGRNVHLMAHSQGGLITSRALGEVAEQLKKENKFELMGRIRVETFGAASGRYPDGPKYVHYINSGDPISNWFGVEGSTSFYNNPGTDIHGNKAEIVTFSEKSFLAAHSYNDVYLKHRRDFGEVYGDLARPLIVQNPNGPRVIPIKRD